MVQHLAANGCVLVREGRGHAVWAGPDPARQGAVPRHRDVNEYTARAVCRQLGVPEPPPGAAKS